jgi:hypothetical protein
MASRWSAKLLLGLVGVLALTATLLGRASEDPPLQRPSGAHSSSTTRPAVPATSASDRAEYLSVDGGRLYYEIAGAGPVIVLLHDGILHSEVWDAQCRDWAE